MVLYIQLFSGACIMRTYYAQMNNGCSAAAACSGWFCAAMAFIAAIFAGIVAAVSVVFFAVSVSAVRLCLAAVLVIVLVQIASATIDVRKR